ncbi:MAG: hypothetical protein JW745_00865, partial [Sedimentisphaerales bacterium]|nr:hypothetical protein [Sedimentisphaerales bacterium]
TWKWMQIDIGVADLEIKNKKCNGPYQSACDTKSLGVNLGQSINLGASAFGFDLVTLVGQIDIKGQIKSTVCGGPDGISMEVKFCGVVDGELSLNLIGADPINVNMSDYYADMVKDGEGCYSAFSKTWRFD